MTRGGTNFWTGLAVVVVATAAGFAAVRTSRARLEAGLHERAARLEVAHPASATPDVGALDAARVAEGQREAARLAGEIEALRRELAAREQIATARSPARLLPSSLPAAPVPANPWPNAGRREPLAAFQTVQWAINEGDLDVLENALALDDAARAAARDFFDRLDPESKVEFRSPERLIAAAIAARSRSGITEAQIVQTVATEDGATSARLRITGPEIKPREITLHFQSSADGWRLQVPAKVVTGYRHLLLGPVLDPSTFKVVH